MRFFENPSQTSKLRWQSSLSLFPTVGGQNFSPRGIPFQCATGRAIDSQVYHHYMPFHSNSNPRATFHANLARLLAFARES